MRMIAPFALLLAACGSGSAVDTTVKVTNHYAESLFTLKYSTSADDPLASLLNGERIASYESKEASFDDAERGDTLHFVIESTSLGEQYSFTFDCEVRASAGIEFIYDWDTATAAFRVVARTGDDVTCS